MKHLNRIILALMIGIFIAVTRSAALSDQAVVFTVGPGGTHATIQAALNTAFNSLGSSPIEIRVSYGTYPENISIPAAMNQGSITLTGGWNAVFTGRDPDPAVTTIDGGAQGRVLDINPSGGELTIDGFTITNGLSGYGSGLRIQPSGDAKVTVINNHIQNNTARWPEPGAASGGGIFAYLPGTTRLFITDNIISDNLCDAGPTGGASGAGMDIRVDHDGLFIIQGNRIRSNKSIAAGGQNTGVGVYINARNAGSGEFSDNLIGDNSAGEGSTVGVAGALWMNANATGRINAKRNTWVDNTSNALSWNVSVISSGTGTFFFTDSVIAGSGSDGVAADARGGSTLYLTNLTIADNKNMGLRFFSGTGTRTLYNSILYNNGLITDLDGVNAGNNLIGVDPKFVNANNRDYRLLPASPAINAGNNDPPGALGPLDLDGLPRVAGGTVDIGACEMGEPDFALGFNQETLHGNRGSKVKVVININRLGGFTGNVTVWPPELSGIGIRPKPSDSKSTTEATLSFKLKIKAGATAGLHHLTFTGRDDSGRERAATLTLVVQ